jgi:hypothetical protein
MRYGLRAVNDHRGVPPMRHSNHVREWIDCAEGVRDMRESHQPCAFVQRFLKFIEWNDAAIVDVYDA